MTDSIITILKKFGVPGNFSVRQNSHADNLHIEIDPIGPLRFPLKPGVVRRMIKIAKPAAFGWRDQTILDSEVRNVWKIPKSRVRIDKRRWNKTLNPTMDWIKTRLGLPEQSRLRAELHEMLVYAPGQFFQPHQDSEKCDGMVATLVVVLPSPHRGGTLIVDHQGEKRRYQSSRAADDKLSFFAFYADCQHEVRPVTDGYRVVLIYNLILQQKDSRTLVEPDPAIQQQLTAMLGSYFTDSDVANAPHTRSKKLIYLLDHEYTPKGISWEVLKGVDQVRAAALLSAASTLDLEVHLALADIKETWYCEIDEPQWAYGSRRRYWDSYDDEDDYEEDGDEENIELLDLIDNSTIIDHWCDATGKSAGLPAWSAFGTDICWTRASNELSPFESQYEGYMGNWGNTMERWYHRAAIVLWRRQDHYAALLEIAPEKVIRELLQLAEKKRTLPQAREVTHALLSHWGGPELQRKIPSSFSPVLRLALKLNDAVLAQKILYPMGSSMLAPKTVPAMVSLQKAYGSHWLIDVMQKWFASTGYKGWGESIDKLTKIVARWITLAPAGGDELPHWLMAWQLMVLKQKHHDQAVSRSPVDRKKGAPARISAITELLTAALLTVDDAIFRDTIDHLINDENDYLIFDLVEVGRFLKQRDDHSEATKMQSRRLLDFVRKKVAAVLDSSPREPEDWSITDPVPCDCRDCKVFKTFLQSSDQAHMVWPLAKDRRWHIHQMIEDMGIPVSHKTARKGRPYKLHLTKTEQLFQQDREYRERLKVAWNDLA